MFLTNQQVGEYQTFFSRIIVAALILMGLTTGGLLIAILTSSFTLTMTPRTMNWSDLSHRPVAVIKDSFEEFVANDLGLQYLTYLDLQSEISALLKEEVIGVMIDKAAAIYYLKHHNQLHLTLAPFNMPYDEMAFAFQKNSPYTRLFNLSLTKAQDERKLKSICAHYVGGLDIGLCEL